MPDNTPEPGDVVIHGDESHATPSYATPSYAIHAVPGPDQFDCATPEEAERIARACAKRSGVNLWFSQVPSGFTLLARFRGARGQPGERPPSMARPSRGGGAKLFGREAA